MHYQLKAHQYFFSEIKQAYQYIFPRNPTIFISKTYKPRNHLLQEQVPLNSFNQIIHLALYWMYSAMCSLDKTILQAILVVLCMQLCIQAKNGYLRAITNLFAVFFRIISEVLKSFCLLLLAFLLFVNQLYNYIFLYISLVFYSIVIIISKLNMHNKACDLKKSEKFLESVKQLGIDSRKQLEPLSQQEINNKGTTLQFSLDRYESQLNSNHESNTQEYNLNFAPNNLQRKNIDKSSHIQAYSEIVSGSEIINNLTLREEKYDSNLNRMKDINDKLHNDQSQRDKVLLQKPKHKDQLKEEEVSLNDKNLSYFPSNSRQISILTKKFFSNWQIEQQQIKQMIKLIEINKISEQEKIIRRKITELQIQRRKLKTETRTISHNKRKNTRYMKSPSQKIQKLNHQIKAEKGRMNQLQTKIVLLNNYIEAKKTQQKRSKKVHETQDYPVFAETNRSLKCFYDMTALEPWKGSDRKGVIKQRLQLVKKNLQKTRNFYAEKEEAIKAEKIYLRKEIQIIKLDLLGLKRESKKYGMIKGRSLKTLKSSSDKFLETTKILNSQRQAQISMRNLRNIYRYNSHHSYDNCENNKMLSPKMKNQRGHIKRKQVKDKQLRQARQQYFEN